MSTQKQLSKLIILSASLSSLLVYSTVTLAFYDSSEMLLANNNKNKGHPASPQIKSAPRASYHPPSNHNNRMSVPNHPHGIIKNHNPSVTTYRQNKIKNHNATTIMPNKVVNKANKINQPNMSNAPSSIKSHGIKPGLSFGAAVTGASIVNSAANINPPHVVVNTKPSHLLNKYTQANIKKSKTLNQRFLHNTNSAKWVKNINGYQKNYKQHYYNNNVQAFNVYNQFWHNHHYHDWYSNWYKWGFYGGFWYPVRPDFDIEYYFDYPVVQWFYVDEPITSDYYSAYYSAEPAPPSACLTAFPYINIYFPTDTLRDLLVEVSGFNQNSLCNFRASIINFTSQMQQIIANDYSVNFAFQQNNIVVNYYQNLQNQAIVIAGFVSQNKINIAFEGLLDLENPSLTIAFSPKGQNPTPDELQALDQLNNRIKSLGGDPFTAQQEPVQGQQTSPGP